MTNITHGFISPLSDGPDPNQVQPSEWNAAHDFTIDHDDLTNVTPDQHHAEDHVLADASAIGPTHSVSGLSAGWVLRALTATTAKFMQLLHTDLGSVGADDHHNQNHQARHNLAGADELEIDDLATDLTDTTLFYRPDGSGGVTASAPSGTGAPSSAQYVTMALDSGLSAERTLAAGTGIGLTDGGANGNATIATKKSGCRAYNNADQTGIVTSTWTDVVWNSERYDDDGYHSNTTNNARFTVPTAGDYVFSASVQWDTNSSGARGLRFNVNGTTPIGATYNTPGNGNPGETIAAVIRLAAGDYVTTQCYQTSGSNRTLIHASGDDYGMAVTRVAA